MRLTAVQSLAGYSFGIALSILASGAAFRLCEGNAPRFVPLLVSLVAIPLCCMVGLAVIDVTVDSPHNVWLRNLLKRPWVAFALAAMWLVFRSELVIAVRRSWTSGQIPRDLAAEGFLIMCCLLAWPIFTIRRWRLRNRNSWLIQQALNRFETSRQFIEHSVDPDDRKRVEAISDSFVRAVKYFQEQEMRLS